MRWLELRVPPLVVLAAFAVTMAAVARLLPRSAWPVPAWPLPGVVLVLAGAAVTSAGVIGFVRHRTTVDPRRPAGTSALVVSGIYRRTRNPMYLGFLLMLAGWSLHLANWATALLLPPFVVYLTRFQIRPEERALAERFGPEFAAYARVVRRWL